MPEASPRLSPMPRTAHGRALHGPALLPVVQEGVLARVVLPPEGPGRSMKQPVGWYRARPDPRYRTAAWKRLAREIVAGKVRVLCGVDPASQADHILGANEKPDLFWQRSNSAPCAAH